MPVNKRWILPVCCALLAGASCASPLLEDPASKLDQSQSEAGSTNAGSDSAGTTSTGATSSTGATASGGRDAGVSGGGTTGMSTSGSTSSPAGGSTDTSGAGQPDTGASGSTGEGGVSGSDTGGSQSTGGDTTAAGGSPEPSGPFETLLFEDDFESDSAGGDAMNWTPLEADGGWTVVSEGGNQYYAPSNEANNRNLTWVDGDWSNVTLEADIRMGSGTDSDTRMYLATRAVENGSKLDYYFMRIEPDENARLGSYINGSTTELGDAADPKALVADTWHRIRLTVDGNTLTMELDGEVVDTQTASGLDAGGIALGVEGGTAEFDNVVLWGP